MAKNIGISIEWSVNKEAIRKAVYEGVSDVLKKEINRTLQAVNRRIQNIEKSGVTSFAYKALKAEIGETTRYTKMSIKGLDLNNKSERTKAIDTYARAVQFLNNSTSTARGAKEYIKNIATKNKLSFEYANVLADSLTNPKLLNGAVVLPMWDSERISSLISEYTDDVNTEYKSAEDLARDVNSQIEKIYGQQTEDLIDIFDL